MEPYCAQCGASFGAAKARPAGQSLRLRCRRCGHYAQESRFRAVIPPLATAPVRLPGVTLQGGGGSGTRPAPEPASSVSGQRSSIGRTPRPPLAASHPGAAPAAIVVPSVVSGDAAPPRDRRGASRAFLAAGAFMFVLSVPLQRPRTPGPGPELLPPPGETGQPAVLPWPAVSPHPAALLVPLVLEPPPGAARQGPQAPVPEDFHEHLVHARRLLDERHPGEAQRLLQGLLPVHRKSPAVHVGLGQCGLDRERFLEAVGHFKQALALRSDYRPAVLGLAQAYRRLGERRQALLWYRRYLELSPEGTHAELARRSIARLE